MMSAKSASGSIGVLLPLVVHTWPLGGSVATPLMKRQTDAESPEVPGAETVVWRHDVAHLETHAQPSVEPVVDTSAEVH
jgi:hypothetical protein